ncbi:plasmid partitioning protein RepB C-terminal domain-containing protein [Pseudolabrys sp.]
MTSSTVKIAFDQRIIMLALDAILPLKQVSQAIKKGVKYRRIAKSIADIGIIEPLVVAPHPEERNKYLLLDGHMRREALVDQGERSARCLVSHDDEAFTFNKRVNRLATVQEHFMIVRALERGVSEEKLASALDVNLKVIKRRKTMLDGICSEVVEMLKDKSVNPTTFDVLRKMKPMRQIETAELMATVANFSSSYAKALLAATRQTDLVKPDKPKQIGGMTPEQMARMEREMETLQRDFKAVESSYGDDVLNLVIASGYLSKIIGNRRIEKYLGQHHPEILEEFKSIISAASLDQSTHTTH